ncbi:MAG: hypothetical protein CO137_03510 [Candidatus Magasanikbacteria bacterium CG_4_9_14_3_um_filter_32_9]|uniref:FCP1 homology domain-containing protein n=1 Tax=Candidatus Magasanikbacteria bacterium CG_4_9_14_3_um_filter_32_9 TaxID=1974644 RepID=A0A2M7Z640_9BACT|nr:MAG: hypothetical protein CO137_03510 [Candidatus Magasanikbacteria bacterium CG_4_9_14_3_um_filter_32_9]
MNLPKNCCLLFDLDGTLVTFKDKKQGLWNIFLKKGISDEIIKENYQKVINSAFNLEKFLDSFENLEKTGIIIEMQNWLNKNIILYPDASFIKNKGFSFILFTFGDIKYQLEKINAVEIKPDLFLFSEKFPKIHTIKSFITSLAPKIKKNGPIIFIDNSFLELDAVRDEGYSENKIITIWLNRNKSNDKPKYKHLEINSLNELNF